MSYKWIFDGEEYQNLIYSDRMWENEDYEYEKEVYEAIQSGRKVCGAIQSRSSTHVDRKKETKKKGYPEDLLYPKNGF